MTATREDVVREALTWVGTPYAHRQRVKGAGVDCAQILIAIYSELGLIEPFDTGAYSQQWMLHRDEPLYLEHIKRHAHEVADPGPGDIALYVVGRQPAHGAIIVDDHSIVHAYRPAGRVILDSRAIPLKLHSCWSCF